MHQHIFIFLALSGLASWSHAADETRPNIVLHYKQGDEELIDLAKDPSETKNLAKDNPKIAGELRNAFDAWIAQMDEPITGGPKRLDGKAAVADVPQTQREKERARVRAERKKQREANKKNSQANVDPPVVADAATELAGHQPHVDASTLTGKVMVGYQGWFNCAGDGANLGWKHWARDRNRTVGPNNVTVDLWPDVSELEPDERFKTDFKHADGSTAEVFSSNHPKTVARHFQWMQDYGIDGAFLQRFAVGLRGTTSVQNENAILAHVRNGARKSGRTYALMYDLSGLAAGQVQRVQEDWSRLRADLKFTEDPEYLHHRGQPLVAVWGIGFSDDRKYSLQECHDLVQYLKADGCSVMLGVPSFWRKSRRDAVADPLLHEVIKLADVVSPWSVGRYRTPEEATRHAMQVWQADLEWCEKESVDFLPVAFPGFSWSNLHGGQPNQIPRLKGKFLWSQIEAAHKVGCEMLYVAMFDEVDEATAIFKCTNDPPLAGGAHFLTMEGLPSDHYLKLTGQAGEIFRRTLSPAETESKPRVKTQEKDP